MDTERLKILSTAVVNDAQNSFGTMNAAIRAIIPGTKLAGPAFTVKCYPGSIRTVHKAILEAEAGDILVVDGEADSRGALLGELMAMQAQLLKLGGIVIDGAVRDSEGIRKLGLPVFARYITPRVSSNRRIGLTQTTISCGGAPVSPGDFILGDEDGVVVIPANDLQKIVNESEAIERKEQEIVKRMENGELLVDILQMRDQL